MCVNKLDNSRTSNSKFKSVMLQSAKFHFKGCREKSIDETGEKLKDFIIT